jgi:hypothetical protein
MFVPTRFLPGHDLWPAPARRWLRAGYLLRHRLWPFLSRDDPTTWAAWRFRRGLRRCHCEPGRRRLARRYPALAEAHSFYRSADPLRRAELEARLLACEDDATVGAKVGLSAPGVAMYHDVFFDIRPRLGDDFYILDVVLRGQAWYVPDPDDHGLLLKLFAYQLGAPFIDKLIDVFNDPPVVPESLDGLGDESLRRLLGKLRTKLLLLATTTPAEALPPEEWLRLQGAMPPIPEPAAGTDAGASSLAALQAAVEAAATLAAAAARGGPRAA